MDGRKKARDKRAKFVELAERRTANAIRSIRLIGNLSNKAHYEFSQGDVRKIVSTLAGELESLKRRFTDTGHKPKVEFSLGD